MNNAAATKPATVRVVRTGTELARYDIATGDLLGLLTLNDWDGYYTVTHAKLNKTIRTQDYDRAHYALALTK